MYIEQSKTNTKRYTKQTLPGDVPDASFSDLDARLYTVENKPKLTVSTTTVLTSSNFENTIYVTTSGITITLPVIPTTPADVTKRIYIINDFSTGTITLNTSGGNLITPPNGIGASSLVIGAKDVLVLISNGLAGASGEYHVEGFSGVGTTGLSPINGNPITASQLKVTNSSPATPVANTLYTNGLPKAWVNFNGVPLTGTYSVTSNICTVTITNHGVSVDNIVNVTCTTGTGVNGNQYKVLTVPNANTYTFEMITANTSGNITQNLYIRSAFNVSSITDNGVGDYTMNYATNFANVNYSPVFGFSNSNNATMQIKSAAAGAAPDLMTTSQLRITFNSTGGVNLDGNVLCVHIFGEQ